jgi:hypothetical protein
MTLLDIPNRDMASDAMNYSIIRKIFPEAGSWYYKFYLAFSQGDPEAGAYKKWLPVECIIF